MSLAVPGTEVKLAGRFKIVRRLGSGSFGEIFEVVDEQYGKYFACKAEHIRSKHPQLKQEFEIYQKLQQSNNFARVYGIIPHGSYSLMIMDKLGESLEQLFTLCGRKFSIKCVCVIALQLISRIQELHNHGWLHRDIKPDNFLIGDGPKNGLAGSQIFMIDLGLGKRWMEGSKHIPHKTDKRLIGTPRYASINTHFGHEQSRRDDLESLGYMLMYFARGSLPWQGLKGNTKEQKYKKIGDTKKKTELNKLCSGFPDEFRQYLESCRELAFSAPPPYDDYKQYFKNVMKSYGYDPDNPQDLLFDWQDENKLHLPAQDRWPPRVTRGDRIPLPNLNSLVKGTSITLHTGNNHNTGLNNNNNNASHIVMQHIQAMNNNRGVDNSNVNALAQMTSNGYRIATTGHTHVHGHTHGMPINDENANNMLPTIGFFCSSMENTGFPGTPYNSHHTLGQQPINSCNNNNNTHTNSNAHTHSALNNNNTGYIPPSNNNNNNNNSNNNLNNNNNNNNNIPTTTQDFTNTLLEKYRALEADRNRYKKKLDECLQEIEHWKQQCEHNHDNLKQFMTQLECCQLQKQQLEVDNENLKGFIQELQNKCSQSQIQLLHFQQLMQYQINSGGNNHTNHILNKNTINDNSHNGNGTNSGSAGSTPEQQISPGIGIGNLYTTMSTSSSSPDLNHKLNTNNSNTTNAHVLNVNMKMKMNMNMNMMNITTGHRVNGINDSRNSSGSDNNSSSSGGCGSGNNVLNTTNNVSPNNNLSPSSTGNEGILPRTHQIIGKKRKRKEIVATYEAQTSRKRPRNSMARMSAME